MKRNYITYHVLRAALSHKNIAPTNVYTQLAETIAERKKILCKYEDMFASRLPKTKDIHRQLAETLAERQRILQLLHRVLSGRRNEPVTISNQRAA
jgi:hypothetical protein